MEHFTWLDYSVFAVYLLATLAIGSLFVRGQSSVAEYFLAGRSVGSVVISMTMLAALFSGISFLAAPAEGYANGPAFYLVNLAFFIAHQSPPFSSCRFFYQSRFFNGLSVSRGAVLGPSTDAGLRVLHSSASCCGWRWPPMHRRWPRASDRPALVVYDSVHGVLTTFYTTLGA